MTPSMAACSAMKPRVQLGVASACMAALASIGPATANTYHNEAFGVSVEIPGRMRTCRTSPPTPDRGFAILPLHGGCDDGDAPRISLSLSYNASLEHRTTREVARDWCGPMPAKWATVPADGVRLMECARPSQPGLETRLYVGLRSTNEEWFGQWTVVAIQLHCRTDVLDVCAGAVWELVRGIRWRR